MNSWKFRLCPRCDGDIYIERDFDEVSEHCLQCGYVKYTEPTLFEKLDTQYQERELITSR